MTTIPTQGATAKRAALDLMRHFFTLGPDAQASLVNLAKTLAETQASNQATAR